MSYVGCELKIHLTSSTLASMHKPLFDIDLQVEGKAKKKKRGSLNVLDETLVPLKCPANFHWENFSLGPRFRAVF